jgi:cytochrome c-type biogenesis protein
MFEVSLFGALAAGLLSFFSPCILPLVPFYLSYLAGSGSDQLAFANATVRQTQLRLVARALVFCAGMITVFVTLGASASAAGQLLRTWFDPLRWMAAAVILLMGLHFLGVFRLGFLAGEVRAQARAIDPGTWVGAYLVGLAFAFGWTPCIGPVLTTILLVAAVNESAGHGALLLSVYGAGMCAPFILLAAFSAPALRFLNRFKQHLGTIEKANGVIMIAFAILLGAGGMASIGTWMLERFAPFQSLG